MNAAIPFSSTEARLLPIMQRLCRSGRVSTSLERDAAEVIEALYVALVTIAETDGIFCDGPAMTIAHSRAIESALALARGEKA